MKNLKNILAGGMIVASLAACTTINEEPEYNTYMKENTMQRPAPIVNTAPTCQTPCNSCPPTEYTVKTPVEITYKNTTYRTVYVPQTTQSVSYEKRPYSGTATQPCNKSECPYR